MKTQDLLNELNKDQEKFYNDYCHAVYWETNTLVQRVPWLNKIPKSQTCYYPRGLLNGVLLNSTNRLDFEPPNVIEPILVVKIKSGITKQKPFIDYSVHYPGSLVQQVQYSIEKDTTRMTSWMGYETFHWLGNEAHTLCTADTPEKILKTACTQMWIQNQIKHLARIR